MPLLRKLWDDDCGGGLLTSELLFLYTTLVLGGVSGLVAVRQAVLSELVETGQSIMALNQSFSFSGQANCESSMGGASASDTSNTISLVSTPGTGTLISHSPLD